MEATSVKGIVPVLSNIQSQPKALPLPDIKEITARIKSDLHVINLCATDGEIEWCARLIDGAIGRLGDLRGELAAYVIVQEGRDKPDSAPVLDESMEEPGEQSCCFCNAPLTVHEAACGDGSCLKCFGEG